MSSVPQSTVYKIDPVLNMFHTIAFDAHHPFVTACYPQQSVLSVSVLNKHMLHLGNDCNDMLLLHHRSPALLHPHQCVLRRQQRLLRRLQKFKLIQRFGKEGIQAPTVSGAQQPAAYQLLLQFVVNADNDVKDRHGATEYIPLRIDLPFQTSLTTDVETGTQVHYSLRLQRGLLCMTTSQHCYWQSMYYLLFVSIAESIASVRQHVHFTHGSNWLSKSKQISFLKKMMANVCPGILRPFQETDTEIPWQHVSNAHSGSSLRLTLLSLETLFLFMIQQRYYQASHPHYQVFVKYLSLLAHCHPPSTTNKDTNGKDWPCQSLLFYEIISRICRKIEYQICHDLFPLQIEASTFTEETEETQEEEGKAKGRFQKMTLLTFFEYCMSQQLYLYANRILTLLCEQLGGSESQLALETCLTLCSEALYASLSSLSLRRSMECMDFVIRLEHVAKLTASASIHSTSATSPGSVQTALGSRKVVLEHIAKHRQHVVALVDDSSTTATSTNGQSKVAGFSWWNLLHVFSNKDNLKTEEEKKRQQEKEDEMKANEDVVTIAYHYTILDRVEQLKRQLNATSSQEESMLSNHSMVGFIISLVIGDWFLEPTRRPTSVSMDMRHLADAAWQTPPSRQYSLQTNHKSHCYITGIYTILLLLSNQVAYQYLRHHIEQMLTDAFLDRILSQVRLVAVEDNNGLPSPSNPIRRGSHSGGNTLGSNHGSGHGSGHGSTHSTTANHYPYQEAHLNESCEDHIRPILLLFKLHKLFMRIHNLPSIHHPVLHDVFHHVTTHSLAQMLQEFVSEHYLRRLMELELHTYASTSSSTTSAAQASDVSPASETQLPPPASTTTTTTTPASDVKLYYDLPGSVEDFEDIYLQAHHPKESVSIGGGGDVVEEDDMFLNYQYRYHTLVDYLRHDLLINADSKMPAPAGSTSPLSVLSYNLICTKESHHTRHYSLFHVLHSTMIAYLLSGDFLPCYYLLYQLRTCLPTHVYDCLQVIHSEHNDISMRRDALKWIVMNYLMVNKRFRGL